MHVILPRSVDMIGTHRDRLPPQVAESVMDRIWREVIAVVRVHDLAAGHTVAVRAVPLLADLAGPLGVAEVAGLRSEVGVRAKVRVRLGFGV